ncbi:hypothetical protein [Sporosarcina sp. OR05]|uniref:hypothetical protein n=1 Tax=Sporosarcina sp. OR05 TaxID=2969819 RepID=UPI00352A8EB6
MVRKWRIGGKVVRIGGNRSRTGGKVAQFGGKQIEVGGKSHSNRWVLEFGGLLAIEGLIMECGISGCNP